MYKSWVIVSLLVLLCGCSMFQYIPTKHIANHQTKAIGDEVFSYYTKQINAKARAVYQFEDSLDMLQGITLLYDDYHDFELYYELNEDIDIQQVMSFLRSLSPQRTRMYFGKSSDFGMLKVEPIHPDEFVLARKEVKRIIAEEMKALDEPAKQVKFVHDYLIKHVAYDVEFANDGTLSQDSLSLSVYGTLFHKLAVCEGYARSFLLFMQELGIPSLIIEAQTMNHAWNYVLIDGSWVFVDVTYDDPVPDQQRYIRQEYLMLTYKELMKKGHHQFDDSAVVGVSYEQYRVLALHVFGN